MSGSLKKLTLYIDGMTCANCESHVEHALSRADGVVSVEVSYKTALASLVYNEQAITYNEIKAIIEETGYTVKEQVQAAERKAQRPGLLQAAGIGIILLSVYIIFNRLGLLNLLSAFPQAKEGMGYGMLFVIGLLTSLHCVAMCGGINLSQCIPQQAVTGKKAGIMPSILYNAGRVISYTVIGGIVGALGSVITFSGPMKGIVAILAGIFMVLMGLNMTGFFPSLRRFVPTMPKAAAKAINSKKQKSSSPLIVGLLNGLMPCGPLQAMQLYALSAGSFLSGALSMMLFALGTVPLMFGLGALASVLSKRFTRGLTRAGAVLVALLGLLMFQNGISLTGFTLPSISTMFQSNTPDSEAAAVVQNGVQTVSTKLESGGYEPIKVQAGIPVHWVISAEKGSLNGCNNSIIIPAYGIEKALSEGDNIIEFTPTQSGTVSFSCWMGMIRSHITVTDTIAGNGK